MGKEVEVYFNKEGDYLEVPEKIPMSVTTLSVIIPCVKLSLFDGKPFNMLSIEADIELTSRMQGHIEFQPTLLGNCEGFDNIVCVRSIEELDRLKSYDLMCDS